MPGADGVAGVDGEVSIERNDGGRAFAPPQEPFSASALVMWRVEIAVRFREDRFHEAEAVGTHGHAADHCHGILCASLPTESAADSLKRRLARGELSNSLLDASVADVDVRAGDHMSHLGLHAAAGAAGNRTESGAETSGDASSDSRVALHKACSRRESLNATGSRYVAPHNA